MHSDLKTFVSKNNPDWKLCVLTSIKIKGVRITLYFPKESTTNLGALLQANKFHYDSNEDGSFTVHLSRTRPDVIKGFVDVLSNGSLITQDFAKEIVTHFPNDYDNKNSTMDGIFLGDLFELELRDRLKKPSLSGSTTHEIRKTPVKKILRRSKSDSNLVNAVKEVQHTEKTSLIQQTSNKIKTTLPQRNQHQSWSKERQVSHLVCSLKSNYYSYGFMIGNKEKERAVRVQKDYYDSGFFALPRVLLPKMKDNSNYLIWQNFVRQVFHFFDGINREQFVAELFKLENKFLQLREKTKDLMSDEEVLEKILSDFEDESGFAPVVNIKATDGVGGILSPEKFKSLLASGHPINDLGTTFQLEQHGKLSHRLQFYILGNYFLNNVAEFFSEKDLNELIDKLTAEHCATLSNIKFPLKKIISIFYRLLGSDEFNNCFDWKSFIAERTKLNFYHNNQDVPPALNRGNIWVQLFDRYGYAGYFSVPSTFGFLQKLGCFPHLPKIGEPKTKTNPHLKRILDVTLPFFQSGERNKGSNNNSFQSIHKADFAGASLRSRREGQSIGAIVSDLFWSTNESRFGEVELIPAFNDTEELAPIRQSLRYTGSMHCSAYDKLRPVQKRWIRVHQTGGGYSSIFKRAEPSSLIANPAKFETTTCKTIAVEISATHYEGFEDAINSNSMAQLISVINFAHDRGGRRILLINQTSYSAEQLLNQIKKQFPPSERERTWSRLKLLLCETQDSILSADQFNRHIEVVPPTRSLSQERSCAIEGKRQLTLFSTPAKSNELLCAPAGLQLLTRDTSTLPCTPVTSLMFKEQLYKLIKALIITHRHESPELQHQYDKRFGLTLR